MVSQGHSAQHSCSDVNQMTPVQELLIRLMTVTAFFSAIAWGAQLRSSIVTFIPTVAASWGVVRLVCFPRFRRLSIAFSGFALMGTAILTRYPLDQVPRWLSHGIFSAWGLLAILTAILIVDLSSFVALRRIQLLSILCSRVAVVALLLAVFIIYMILWPTVQMFLTESHTQTSRVLEDISASEWLRLKTTEFFFAVWFFSLGASVGSFLNVVVYRIPRREALVLQSSKCPHCCSRIQMQDNIPVLGWLRLRGKCRNCTSPISARYPIVEAVTGAGCLVLYFVELISGGNNLPIRPPNAYSGVVWILLYTKWDLVGLYLFHCGILCTLLSWGLICSDRHRVPGRSVFVVTLAAFSAVVCFPNLVLVPWTTAGVSLLDELSTKVALETVILGWVVGVSVGGVVAAILNRNWFTSERISWFEIGHGLGLIGLAWGWQSVIRIAGVTTIVHLCLSSQLLSTARLRAVCPELLLVIVALLHLLCWKMIST